MLQQNHETAKLIRVCTRVLLHLSRTAAVCMRHDKRFFKYPTYWYCNGRTANQQQQHTKGTTHNIFR